MSSRILPVVVALALGAGAVSAFAQSAPVPADLPEGSTAARTLEQNRRVLVGRPAQPEARDAAAEPGAPPAVRADRARIAPAAGGAGRVGLAAGGKPGVPRGGS